MYAIVNDRGRQYTVKEGDRLDVDLLDRAAGDTYEFDKVLLFKKDEDVRVGKPNVPGVKVKSRVLEPEVKAEKLIVFRFRRRKDSKKKRGHRQKYTRVLIESITTE